MMTRLPLLAIPFLTLFFWALGGGKDGAAPEASAKSKTGMNLDLPDARLKEGIGDKLSLYQQALKDSLELADVRRTDPYSQPPMDSTGQPGLRLPDGYNGQPYPSYQSGYAPSLPANSVYSDANERKVRNRLAALQEQLQEEPPQPSVPAGPDPETASLEAQLKAVMEGLQNGNTANAGTGADPEMAQINSMLDKVLDIQHPGRTREKLRQESEQNKGQVFSVSTQPAEVHADLLQPAPVSASDSLRPQLLRNSFFDGTAEASTDEGQNKAIPAVVHEEQTLVAGATVKLRLTEDVYINGRLVPKDNFVYGVCALDGERLTVSVKYIRFNDNLFPVSLSVVDLDGIEGIRIPGAITRDASKQGLDQAIQSMELYSMDPSIGAQAASAGMQTAKSLLSKKTKMVRATVRAGYPVLLLDQNKRNP